MATSGVVVNQRVSLPDTSKAKMKTRLVYILAASHSGSTLLASLLSNHPMVCTAGELKLNALGEVQKYRCSCRALIERCPFWLGICEDMARRGFSFSVGNAGTDLASDATPYVRFLLRPLHRGLVLEWLRETALALSPQWRVQLPQIQARNAALAACISARAGKPIVVDSSKLALRLKYLARNPGLDVRAIRLIRDGRGVALTYTDPARFADAQDPTLRGGGTGSELSSERVSFADAAWEWRRSTEEAEAVLSTLPQDRWTVVRYEDLCTRPIGVLHSLFGFIGVDADLGLMLQPSDQQHIVGNGMRFDTMRDVVLDERWKSLLKTQELQTFDSIAGQLSRRLGYT